MSAVPFSEWIKQQTHRADPIGDVARDATADPNWPPNADLDELCEYLPERLHRFLEEAEDDFLEESMC